MRYAFFDFDGTVIKGDSIILFCKFCLKNRHMTIPHVIRTAFAYVYGRIRKNDFRITKEVTLSFLKNKTKSEIQDICLRFMTEMIRPGLYPKAVSEIKKLKSEGYRIVIVSASTSCYMDLLPQILPVDSVISTEMEYINNRFSGHIGPNCKGENKVVAIKEYMNNNDESCDYEESVAFGDSASDLPMLRLTGSPYLVSPSPSLRRKFPDIPVKEWMV